MKLLLSRFYVRAVLLLLVAFLAGIPIWAALLDTTPQTLEDVRGDATVWFSAADSSFVFSHDCVFTTWNVQGIRTVALNGVGVIGEDSRISCHDRLALEIQFQDGTRRVYTLPKHAVSDTLPGRAAIVAVAVSIVLAAAMLVKTLPIWSALAASRPARLLGRLLPVVRAGWPPRGRALDLLIVTVIVIASMVARVEFLSQPLKYDEAWTYNQFASQPLAIGLSTYNSTNNHLFYTFMMHLSVQVFGVQPWVLRLPAFFAGVLMIPMTFLATRHLFRDRAAAWFAAALVAGSSQAIEFSVNGRGYTTITLIFLALFVVTSRLLRHPARGGWLLLAALSAVGLYTVPTMLYPLGIIWGWLVLAMVTGSPTERPVLLRGLLLSGAATAMLTLALYSPILFTGSWVEGETTRILSTLGTGEFLNRLNAIVFETWARWTRDLPEWFVLLLVAGFAVAVVLSSRVARQPALWWLAGLVWLPAVTFIQQVSTYSRLWLFLLPVFLMAAAVGLVYLLRFVLRRKPHSHQVAVAVFSVITAIWMSSLVVDSQSVYFSSETGLFNDAQAIVELMLELPEDGDLVLCAGSCHPMRFYANLAGLSLGSLTTDIPPETRHVYLIFSTFFAEQRIVEPVFAALPPDVRAAPREHLIEYSHADIYRLDLTGSQ